MSDLLNRRPSPPIPVTILTGFLGSGKTTLLNALLRDPSLADAVVLINEFGEIGLDHLLIERVDGDTVLMSSGCLCCTVRGELSAMLEDLLRRRDNGRITPFNRVIIETTGLADPAPVLHTIMNHPYLLMRYRLDGVVTLVDAVNGAQTLDRQKEAVRQVAVADRLVLTKTDLLAADPNGPALRAALLARLAALNPAAPRMDAHAGEAKLHALFNAGLFSTQGKIADVAHWLRAEAFDDHHAHDRGHSHVHHEHAHSHDVNRHDESIEAFCLVRDEPLSAASFDIFMQVLRHAHGPRLLRVKGLIALADDISRPLVIHGVQHVFHPAVRLDAWPDDDRRTRIVFILDSTDRSFIEQLYAAASGAIAPDAPDMNALSQRPLSLNPGGLLAE